MMMRGMPARHVEGRLTFLKTELKVTDAQTLQWNAFADVVRANAKSATEMQQAMMTSRGDTVTLPERLEHRERR